MRQNEVEKIAPKIKLNFSVKNLKNDIFAGLLVALVSIPISMGYAQVAGLPAVYGLYGSLLPILVYGFFASSPQFVVGVDAMPAALVGAELAEFGIMSGSPEALHVVPAITILVALWLLVFRVFQAGRVVKYISNPVMGGFISGVGITIIFMQIPKLFGGNAGTGEIIVLVQNIIHELPKFNWVSFVLGLGTVVIIMVFKKFLPKIPMTVVMLGVGIILAAVFKIDRYGVKLLPAVEGGLPKFIFPNVLYLKDHILQYLVLSLSIAAVIMAQTLLSANAYASKYDYPLDNNRELLAYSMMNIAGAVTGSCPINGSVSRSGIADQFGCKSQVMSLTAFAAMLLVVLFCTPFFVYLPVPILTGIVMSALIGIIDFKQAKRLWKCDQKEFWIFIMALLGVLFLGTIYGVVVGVILSFVAVVTKAVVPPRAFLGKIPGHHGYYDLSRNKNSTPICNTVIYRFGGNLFFANVDTFQKDLEEAVTDDTKFVIVDAGGVGNIDVTAADRLVYIADKFEKKGIKFYLTEHQGQVNDLLRKYGAAKLIEEGKVRRTMSLALRDCGFSKPYPLVGGTQSESYAFEEEYERLPEFEWAFGKDAEDKMQEFAGEMLFALSNESEKATAEQISHFNLEELEKKLHWGRIGIFDEDVILQRMESRFGELVKKGKLSQNQVTELEKLVEKRKQSIEEKVSHVSPHALEMLKHHKNR